MTITIKTLANGATVNIPGESGTVYKFQDEEMGGLAEMLYDIADAIEPGSRYSKERVRVKIVHGDKYECPDRKSCAVCQEAF